MVLDSNYGYSVRQLKHILSNGMDTVTKIKDADIQTAILANFDAIKMIVNILEREIPEDQK